MERRRKNILAVREEEGCVCGEGVCVHLLGARAQQQEASGSSSSSE